MTEVFANTLYWIARVRPNDPWQAVAVGARQKVADATLVTTDEVLSEFLTALSRGGPALRSAAVAMVRAIMNDPLVIVVPQTHEGFLTGIGLYESRRDKDYSLVDCISMNVMRNLGLTEVLTNDHHFEQEGFRILIK